MGYMHNEIYRYAQKYELYDGSVTRSFWADDIRIDTLSTNIIANPTDNRRLAVSNPLVPYPSCINGGLPDYDLTDVNANNVYVAYIEPSGQDMNFVIDGIPAKDLIKKIIFEVVEMKIRLSGNCYYRGYYKGSWRLTYKSIYAV